MIFTAEHLSAVGTRILSKFTHQAPVARSVAYCYRNPGNGVVEVLDFMGLDYYLAHQREFLEPGTAAQWSDSHGRVVSSGLLSRINGPPRINIYWRHTTDYESWATGPSIVNYSWTDISST